MITSVAAKPSTARLVLAGSLALIVVAFWPTLVSFGQVWDRVEYSHGYLSAVVVAWLVWRDRDIFRGDDPGHDLAIIPLVGFSVLWMAATVMHIQVVHQAVLPVLLLSWVAFARGLFAAERLLLVAAIWLCAVPLWNVFTPLLQELTIVVSGSATDVLGIGARISREFISLESGIIRVAGTCAGLNFFVVGLSIGILYAHLELRRWRTRIAFVVSAGILAVMANWIRVTGLIVIGHATSMRSGLMEDHEIYGWVVFLAVLLALIPIGGVLRRWERSGFAGTSSRKRGPTDSKGMGDLPDPRRTFLATGAAVLGPAIYFLFTLFPASASEMPEPPSDREGWSVLDPDHARPYEWQPRVPAADEHQRAGWTNGSTRVFRDWIVIREQEQGAELIGYDSRIVETPSRVLASRMAWDAERRHPMQQLLVRTPDGLVLVWYWYRIGGSVAADPATAKFLELWAFFRRRPQSELLAFSALCASDGCDQAQEAIADFVHARGSGP